MDCMECIRESWKWLQQEYEPPLLENGDGLKVGDWIMVRLDEQDFWLKQQFCYFYKGRFYCIRNNNLEEQTVSCMGWSYARLLKEGE